MKRRYSHIVYTCLAVVILASCNPHYPDKNFEGSLGYVADDLRVPMLLAVNDSSLYGMGAFGGDEMSTDSIYVYAFYTPSPEVKGAPGKVDYRERMDAQDDEAIYCLVDDADSIGHGKRACLSSSTSFLHWADNDVAYYNGSYPKYCYKFFAYYLDGAVDMGNADALHRDSASVYYDIEIDGTQDLVCGYAELTEKQKRQSDLHIEGTCYTAETARRNLFPVFRMKHQLVGLKFGAEIGGACVKGVPYKGRFVVAADDVSEMGVEFDYDELTDFDVEGEELLLLLPEANQYDLQLQTNVGEVSATLVLDNGTFEAGHEYEVCIEDDGTIDVKLKSQK